MRYYKEVNKNGRVVVIGIGLGHEEITEEEYERLKYEMHEKSVIINKLYRGEITIDSVPEEWRDEVQEKIEAYTAEYGTYDERELSAEDALEIILGGAE